MLRLVSLDLKIMFWLRLEKNLSYGLINELKRGEKELRAAYQTEYVFHESIDRIPGSIGFHQT